LEVAARALEAIDSVTLSLGCAARPVREMSRAVAWQVQCIEKIDRFWGSQAIPRIVKSAV